MHTQQKCCQQDLLGDHKLLKICIGEKCKRPSTATAPVCGGTKASLTALGLLPASPAAGYPQSSGLPLLPAHSSPFFPDALCLPTFFYSPLNFPCSSWQFSLPFLTSTSLFNLHLQPLLLNSPSPVLFSPTNKQCQALPNSIQQ